MEALTFLFVPPLIKPLIEPKDYAGINRRVAIFPNRNYQGSGNWAHLYNELGARMIPFGFENCDAGRIGAGEVNDTLDLLNEAMGRFAVLCSNEEPGPQAHSERNMAYREIKTVILFITPDKLIEMIAIKERGEDPSNLILDLIELCYARHKQVTQQS